MASDLNRFTFSGRLTRDAERRVTPNGKGIISFSVANNRGYGDRATVNYFNVTVFSDSEKFQNALTRGTKVIVSGSVNIRKYEKEGTTQYFTEVLADNFDGVVFIGDRTSSDAGQNTVEFEDDVSEDDEVPF